MGLLPLQLARLSTALSSACCMSDIAPHVGATMAPSRSEAPGELPASSRW